MLSFDISRNHFTSLGPLLSDTQ
jgi:hypothetical protein